MPPGGRLRRPASDGTTSPALLRGGLRVSPGQVITSPMQLRLARLCLDCEEVHDAQQCPVCASETFAYLTRWVAAPERRSTPRPPETQPPTPAPEAASAPRRSHKAMIGYGMLGLGVLGVGQWLLRGREKIEKKIESAGLSGAGELK